MSSKLQLPGKSRLLSYFFHVAPVNKMLFCNELFTEETEKQIEIVYETDIDRQTMAERQKQTKKAEQKQTDKFRPTKTNC